MAEEEVVTIGFGRQKMEDITGSVANADMSAGSVTPAQDAPDLPPSKPRTDFRETAFFFPQLATNADGEIILRFTMPEALTRWRMMGLAHTKDLKTAMIEKSLITQKEIMVFPNAPRFLREGDVMEFSAMVSNLSGKPLTGTAGLHFFDALTMAPLDDQMKLATTVREFSMAEGGNAPLSWQITVPEGIQAVVYRITATAGQFLRWRGSPPAGSHQPHAGHGIPSFARAGAEHQKFHLRQAVEIR